MGCSLAGALAITFGLVRVHLAHALEEFLGIGFLDFGRAGAFTAAAAAGTHGPCFLCLVWHKLFFVVRIMTLI